MDLVPTQVEVIDLLRSSGALRQGHFEISPGLHASQIVEPAIAMRHYCDAKTLGVALSRLIRANPELRALIPELSIVATAPGGLPVAYELCQALRARQVYWAEKQPLTGALRFPQYLEPQRGEPVVLVNDVLCSGASIATVKALIESHGAGVKAIAVLVRQPAPDAVEFASTPVYALAGLEPLGRAGADSCALCQAARPVDPLPPGWIFKVGCGASAANA
jgi:orotate phosphoribosyltransferase